MNILLLHPGALGDMILSLPALSLLRDAFPWARLTLAADIDHLDSIVSGCVDQVLSLSALPLHRLYSSEKLPEQDRRFWGTFDHVVSWTGAGDASFRRNLLAVHPGARIAAWKPEPDDPRHVSQIFADSLGLSNPAGAASAPVRLSVNPRLGEEGRRWMKDRGWNAGDRLIAIHPGAGSVRKRWQLSRFFELARHIAMKEKRRVLIVEGPAEPGLCRHFGEALPERNIIMSDAAPLGLLASILTLCGLFIGNDSGIAHLAAALGLPCVVIFGPTLPQHWAPLGPNVSVLRNPGDCAGCGSGSAAHTCLDNISVESVIREAFGIQCREWAGNSPV